MKRRIYLHGSLKKLHDGPIELDTNTVAEAIEALSYQIKGLKPLPGQPKKRIKVLGFDTDQSLHTPTDKTELHIVPAFAGGKQGGFLQMIAGAVLIVIGAILVITGYGAALGYALIASGVTMIAGGIIALLSPQPNIRSDTATDPEASKYLGSPKNTVKIGTRIPVIYGRRKHFGHILSMNIDAVDVAV